MNAKVEMVERTYAHGRNRYRVNSRGEWSALLWGFFPTGPTPRYQWSSIPTDKVPAEVRAEAER